MTRSRSRCDAGNAACALTTSRKYSDFDAGALLVTPIYILRGEKLCACLLFDYYGGFFLSVYDVIYEQTEAVTKTAKSKPKKNTPEGGTPSEGNGHVGI